MIRRAAALYDEVVVAVVNRSVRKSSALFGIEERVGFIERALADLDSVRVEPFSTLVVDFAQERRARRRSSRDCARSPTSSTSWR